MVTIVYGFWSFGILFVCCEIGQRGSDLFIEIDDVITQFKWYLFPCEIKPMLLTIIIMVKQPVQFKCFGSISCNREIFKQVKKNTILILCERA